MQRVLLPLLAIISALVISSCGAGGGSGDTNNPALKGAHVAMDIDPTAIRIGDRTQVWLDLTEVDDKGVIVKMRFPETYLSFIENTSTRTVNGKTDPARPVAGPRSVDGKTYVIYYFTRKSFDNEGTGRIGLQLRGEVKTHEARVEVDLDVHDPKKDPADEFSFSDPLFSEEDEGSVSIDR